MRAIYGILGACFLSSGAVGAAECAEGDWNCVPPESATPAPDGAPSAPAAAPAPQEAAPAPAAPQQGAPVAPARSDTAPPAGAEANEPPPAVVYETRRRWDEEEEAPPPVIVVDPRTRPGDPAPEEIGVRPSTARLRPRQRERWEPLWGVNARGQMALGGSRGRSVDMYGLGGGLRYRPVPHFALDVGVDFLSGNDWHGHRRLETAFGASALVYFNPESSFQLYLPVGLHGSGARVQVETAAGTDTRQYRYFGAHAGLGAEIRLGPRVAVPIELLGFIRGRTDGAARSQPEFVDENTHLVTNSSGGGLLRAGVVVYF